MKGQEDLLEKNRHRGNTLLYVKTSCYSKIKRHGRGSADYQNLSITTTPSTNAGSYSLLAIVFETLLTEHKKCITGPIFNQGELTGIS